MPEIAIKLSHLPTRHQYLVMKQVDGREYLFHSKKTAFFSLNTTARTILDLCDGKHRTADIILEVARVYGADAAEVARDVAEYLATLNELEIVAFREGGETQETQPDGSG